MGSNPEWPELKYASWRETALTLQLWSQIVGKVRLELAPWLNHGWQVTLYVTAHGLGTSPMPFDDEIVELDFDFVRHRLVGRTSRGETHAFALEAQTVAEFFRRIVFLLSSLGVRVEIRDLPSELPQPIPFSQDRTHSTYNPIAAHRFWRALVQADRIFKLFRSGFLGKASPVHFFWGGFDLAVTRFSGRRAPLHPGGIPGLPDKVTREAYSHEVSSAGFWPGNDSFPRAAFYSYAYPEPPGFREQPVPLGAYFDAALGEFILPYERVQTACDPDALLLDFLTKTYEAAAETADWDRDELECSLGLPARVRPLKAVSLRAETRQEGAPGADRGTRLS